MKDDTFLNMSYFSQLIGRKIINLYSNPSDNKLYLLLEGGYKLELNEFNYISIIDRFDTNKFSALEIQKILYNPIYAFGILLEPFSIFQEYFDIYLYIMSLLPINLNNRDKLQKSYEIFLEYIQEMVCEKVGTASPIISKEMYFDALQLHISNAKKILRGEDEPNISKNFILNTQNRLLYYHDLIHILSLIYPDEYATLQKHISWNAEKARQLIEKTKSKNNQEKGKALEDLADYFLSCVKGIKITSRNQTTETEELDLCVCTYTTDSTLCQIGSFVLVECKNRSKNISSQMLRNMSQIMDSKGAYTTILFTHSALTTPAKKEIDKFKRLGKYFILITIDDIIHMETSPTELFKQKIKETFTLNSPFGFVL